MASASPAVNFRDMINKPERGLITTGWLATAAKLPPNPDQIIFVRDTGGPASESGVGINYPTIQVIVRGPKTNNSYDVAYNKAAAVRDAFLAVPSTEWVELTAVNMLGDLLDLGHDDNERARVAVNFRLIVTPINSGHRELY